MHPSSIRRPLASISHCVWEDPYGPTSLKPEMTNLSGSMTSCNCDSDSRVWGFRKLWEFKAEISTWGDIDSLKDTQPQHHWWPWTLWHCCARLCSEVVIAYIDMCHHVSKVGNAVETTAQVAPKSDAEEDWVHKSEDVKAISLPEKVQTPCNSIGIGRHSHTHLKLGYVVFTVSPGLSLAIVIEESELRRGLTCWRR